MIPVAGVYASAHSMVMILLSRSTHTHLSPITSPRRQPVSMRIQAMVFHFIGALKETLDYRIISAVEAERCMSVDKKEANHGR